MSIFEDGFLGLLQGLGEFLPISSSAQLILIPWLLGWAEHPLSLDVALHVGTLVAVLVAFAADWVGLLKAGFSGLLRGDPFSGPEGRLLGFLLLASIPGGIAGLLLEKRAETVFRSPLVVASCLAAGGVVLLAADRLGAGAKPLGAMTAKDALLIGLSQGLAVIPGVSRSGITIAAALALGYPREASARFSFLLATPIILGAAALKVPHLLRSGDPTGILVGMAVSALVGLLAIRFLLGYVRKGTYIPFVVYRFLVALVVFMAAFLGWRHLG
jgi:undecaprenyl-diphosphatase